jgi:hypothetical protein
MPVSVEQPETTATERARHWDAAYARSGAEGVSWHQDTPAISLALIDELGVPCDTPVLDVGGGASTLVDRLVERGFTDLSVLDTSLVALQQVRTRPSAAHVRLLNEDVLGWRPARRFGLWHDRAVLHFLVDVDDRDRYLATMRAAIGTGRHAIVGTFAADGPETCSGLPVVRYSPEELVATLGPGFELLATRREDHVTPRGVVQPFTWVAGRIGVD